MEKYWRLLHHHTAKEIAMTRYLPVNKLIVVMVIYCIVAITGMYHHELWMDDVQHWLIARDSKTFIDLIHNGNADDHVPLWKMMLYVVTHFISQNPVAIQVLHLIVIITIVFIFLCYAPFDLVAKILIIFGYYFIFEYSILCRNYAIGILLLFVVCALLSKPKENLIWIGVLLMIICSTHELVAIAAVSVFLYLLCYAYEHKALDWRFAVFTVLVFIGMMVPVLHVLSMRQDNVDFKLAGLSWMSVHNVSAAIHGIDKGFIPFPPLHDPNFWNRHLFEAWSSYIKVPMSLLFLIFPVWVLRKSKKALIYYISASFLLLLFLIISKMSASRHYGMFFIYFITAIWLADIDGVNILSINTLHKYSTRDIVATGIFYAILVTQMLAGVYIYEQDYTRPFSQGKATVAYVRMHCPDEPVVLDVYNAGAVLSAYFMRPLYCLDRDTMGSYFPLPKTLGLLARTSLAQQVYASKYVASLHEFILISNRDNADAEVANVAGFGFTKLSCFTGAIIPVENYCVYKVVKNKP